MRITSKGQVTIPAAIRQRAGLLPHTDVEFVVDGKSVRIVRTKDTARGRTAVGRLRGSATVKMTTDAILALTRGR